MNAIFSRFAGQRTVNSVLASFTNTITALREVEAEQAAEAERQAALAKQAAEAATEAATEATRAGSIASRFEALVAEQS